MIHIMLVRNIDHLTVKDILDIRDRNLFSISGKLPRLHWSEEKCVEDDMQCILSKCSLGRFPRRARSHVIQWLKRNLPLRDSYMGEVPVYMVIFYDASRRRILRDWTLFLNKDVNVDSLLQLWSKDLRLRERIV